MTLTPNYSYPPSCGVHPEIQMHRRPCPDEKPPYYIACTVDHGWECPVCEGERQGREAMDAIRRGLEDSA